jgi:hypothetical protein
MQEKRKTRGAAPEINDSDGPRPTSLAGHGMFLN